MTEDKKERRRQQRKLAYQKPETKERIRAQVRAWRNKNRDKVNATKREKYNDDIEKSRAANKAHYLRTKEDRLQRERNRRATDIEWWDNKKEQIKMDRAQNPEKYRRQYRRFRKNNRAAVMLSGAKRNAKQKNVAFDLDREWFLVRLQTGRCELSGLSFDMESNYGVQGRGPNSPSIDRIDPKGGYTKDNCRLILWFINRALIDLGDDYCLHVFRSIFIKRGEIIASSCLEAA